MINDRLKKIIFKKLYKNLSKVEIIPYQESIWFIDREKKYWYLEYMKDGTLWWRHDFFSNFFYFFSLELNDYEPIICEWAEQVLNFNVIKPRKLTGMQEKPVEEALDFKVNTSLSPTVAGDGMVVEILKHKVFKSYSPLYEIWGDVEKVLKHKVITPGHTNITHPHEMEDVLSFKVTEPLPERCGYPRLVESIINHNVINK